MVYVFLDSERINALEIIICFTMVISGVIVLCQIVLNNFF